MISLNQLFGQDILEKAKKRVPVKILKALEEISAELGCSQAQLTLAWTIINKDTSTCIFGATNEK